MVETCVGFERVFVRLIPKIFGSTLSNYAFHVKAVLFLGSGLAVLRKVHV